MIPNKELSEKLSQEETFQTCRNGYKKPERLRGFCPPAILAPRQVIRSKQVMQYHRFFPGAGANGYRYDVFRSPKKEHTVQRISDGKIQKFKTDTPPCSP